MAAAPASAAVVVNEDCEDEVHVLLPAPDLFEVGLNHLEHLALPGARQAVNESMQRRSLVFIVDSVFHLFTVLLQALLVDRIKDLPLLCVRRFERCLQGRGCSSFRVLLQF